MKLLKKISLFGIAMLGIASITSCGNKDATTTETAISEVTPVFSEGLCFYPGTILVNGNLNFYTSGFETMTYDTDLHELQYDISINMTNHTEDIMMLTIDNAKAWGNEEALEESVYSSYSYQDEEMTSLFAKQEFSLNPGESKKISFTVVIPEGNVNADISIKADINNATLEAFCYYENEKSAGFEYVHDPDYNATVKTDAVVNPSAVYGYSPSTEGSLAAYASYDWTDTSSVADYKQSRIDYIESNDLIIASLEEKLTSEGKTIEEIARACSAQRNQNRLASYKNDPEGLATVKARNLEKYGNEEGPTADSLYEKYGSWEIVLSKCYSTNRAMDAICGVYDEYYYLYADLLK